MAKFCALSSLALSSSALLRQEFSESWVEAGLNHMPRVEGALEPPPQYYDQQTVDHFSEQSGTFTQKFYEDAEFYVPGGPVFLYIGGEGPMSSSAVTGRTVNHYLAQVFGGTTVALEHRFYGESQPFDSLATEHLDLLTSRQALHDLAQFQQWYVAERNLTGAVFCLGGSYPGNLAAWYRLEFPDLTAGCWSASGPVHAQEDWPGFGQKVWEAMSTTKFNTQDDEPAKKLYLGYQQLAELIQDGTPGASVAVQERLNACPGSLTSQADRDNWEMSITTYPGLIMQYNNTYPVHLADIKTVVQAASTPLDAAFAVTDFLNVTKSAEGHRFPDTRKKQADVSTGPSCRIVSNVTCLFLCCAFSLSLDMSRLVLRVRVSSHIVSVPPPCWMGGGPTPARCSLSLFTNQHPKHVSPAYKIQTRAYVQVSLFTCMESWSHTATEYVDSAEFSKLLQPSTCRPFCAHVGFDVFRSCIFYLVRLVLEAWRMNTLRWWEEASGVQCVVRSVGNTCAYGWKVW